MAPYRTKKMDVAGATTHLNASTGEQAAIENEPRKKWHNLGKG